VVRSGRRASKNLAILALALAAFGAVGALLAWAIGPFLLTWLVSASYFIDGGTLALLTLSAAVLAMVTLTGAVAQALSLHRWFVVGWVLAVAVSASLLLVPGPLAVRAVWSLAAGPLVGCVVHSGAIVRAVRARPLA
jgi:hypothetical protein